MALGTSLSTRGALVSGTDASVDGTDAVSGATEGLDAVRRTALGEDAGGAVSGTDKRDCPCDDAIDASDVRKVREGGAGRVDMVGDDTRRGAAAVNEDVRLAAVGVDAVDGAADTLVALEARTTLESRVSRLREQACMYARRPRGKLENILEALGGSARAVHLTQHFSRLPQHAGSSLNMMLIAQRL